jgi:hypothetical protein
MGTVENLNKGSSLGRIAQITRIGKYASIMKFFLDNIKPRILLSLKGL